MDNHSAHHNLELHALANANLHLVVYGSIHSPDFAPAEWAFSHAIKYAQLNAAWIRLHPAEYVQVFAAGLRSITREYMMAYFADAHFPVPGLIYKPYL